MVMGMTAFLLDGSMGGGTYLEREDLRSGLPEHWLRDRIFENPRLIPLDKLDPSAGDLIPLCREFPLSKYGSPVYLDILGVTRQGRLVLIECKLWRNPQARREVVAQLLEYASLLRRLRHSDLTSILKTSRGLKGENPIFDIVAAHVGTIREAEFTDFVAKSLERGDFDLIIAGDGIREDMTAIAEHLLDRGSRLALVELQIWRAPGGQRLLVPHIPFRTEVVKQRILVDQDDRPVLAAESTGSESAPVPFLASETQNANRAFWERFIREAEFDHPDQGHPSHGGNNWVKIPMPSPGRWLTGYRLKERIGFYLVLEKNADIGRLIEDIESMREETGLEALWETSGSTEGAATIGCTVSQSELGDEDAQIAWLKDVSNRLVSAFRPRLAQLGTSRPQL